MQFYKDTLALEILEHLNRISTTPRKQLYTPFSSYSYRYYANLVKRLIDEGYLEIYPYKRVTYIRLTQKGYNVLVDRADSPDEVKKQAAKANNPQKKKRLSLVTDVLGLCKANEFIVDEENKPLLEDLFERGAAPVQDTKRNLFERSLKTGIFYSSGEIRDAYAKVSGKSEIANWSRLVGILLLGKNISFLYGVGGNLIKWMAGSEDRTVKNIINFLKKSDIIKNNIIFYEHPSCIVCGRGNTLIPKIVYGRKWGKISEKKDRENFQRVIARDHINSHNLAKVFVSAYYVPVSAAGADSFKLAAMLDEPTKERICNKWFEEIPSVSRVKNFAYHQGLTPKHERVVYMPYIDLIELEFYKRQGEACHFVIPKGTQEAVARVMGPLLLSAKDLDGKNLKHNSYDTNGCRGKME